MVRDLPLKRDRKFSSCNGIRGCIRNIQVFVLLCCCVNHVTGGVTSCQDIDALACQSMFEQNPSMCSDPTLSLTICPNFCKNCPLLCYSCNDIGLDYSNCNTVTCSGGEKCMTITTVNSLTSSSVYTLGCGSKEVCSSTSRRETLSAYRRFIVNDNMRNDTMVKCCNNDQCNVPTQPQTTQKTTTPSTTQKPTTTTQKPTTTTQKPTTTTQKPTTTSTTQKPTSTSTTQKTTTAIHVPTKPPTTTQTTMATTSTTVPTTPGICKSDVIVMISSSNNLGKIQNFLFQMISSMDIGINASRVAIGTFNKYSGSTLVGLDRGYDKFSILYTLNNLNDVKSSNSSNLVAVTYLLDNFRTGNRNDVTDDVIIISDGHYVDTFFLAQQGSSAQRITDLHGRYPDVHVIAYGDADIVQLKSIATDSKHYKFHSWTNPSDFLIEWLKQEMCK